MSFLWIGHVLTLSAGFAFAQALISLTTTAHVDIVDPSASVWEFFLGIFTIIFSTFIYTFTVANVTSTLLRQDRLIEGYRGRLEQVYRLEIEQTNEERLDQVGGAARRRTHARFTSGMSLPVG